MTTNKNFPGELLVLIADGELAALRCEQCDAVIASVTLKPSNRIVDLMRMLERAAHVVRGSRP